MYNLFYPWNYEESVFDIDFELLYHKGYRGIIFDIDNTLVFQDEDCNVQVEALFLKLYKIGFKTFIISNNSKSRVERFTENIDTPFISKALKPLSFSYLSAVKRMGLKRNEVLFIGDQIFTDILGANFCSIANVLVKHIESDSVQIMKKRKKLEERILKKFNQSRLGNIKIKD